MKGLVGFLMEPILPRLFEQRMYLVGHCFDCLLADELSTRKKMGQTLLINCTSMILDDKRIPHTFRYEHILKVFLDFRKLNLLRFDHI